MNEQLWPKVPIITSWAGENVRVRRVWLYGSRVRGTHRSDSDLDICVEIDRLTTEHERTETWRQLTHWQSELSALCELQVHLEPYATDQQKQFVEKEGQLVYERKGLTS